MRKQSQQENSIIPLPGGARGGSSQKYNFLLKQQQC